MKRMKELLKKMGVACLSAIMLLGYTPVTACSAKVVVNPTSYTSEKLPVETEGDAAIEETEEDTAIEETEEDTVMVENGGNTPEYQYKLTFSCGDRTNIVYDESNIDFYDDVIEPLTDSSDYDSAEITDIRYAVVTVSNESILSVQQEFFSQWNETYYETILLHGSFTGTQTITLSYHDSQEGYANKTYTFSVTYEGPEMTGCEYIDRSGNVRSALPVTLTGNETSLSEGWYIVNDNIDCSSLSLSGEVNLIIADGKKLTVNGAIKGEDGSELYIYKQTLDGTRGELEAGSITGLRSLYVYDGNLSVSGGISSKYVYIYNGEHNISNTIGHAISCEGGFFEMYGGTLTAQGGTEGYGIYAPNDETILQTGIVTIYGGHFFATGGAGGIKASNRINGSREGVRFGWKNKENDSFYAKSYDCLVWLNGEFMVEGKKYGDSAKWISLTEDEKNEISEKTLVPVWTGYPITFEDDDGKYVTVNLKSGESYEEDGITYFKNQSEVTFEYNRPGYKELQYTVKVAGVKPQIVRPGDVYKTLADDMTVSVLTVSADYWSGEGTEESPFIITSVDGWNKLADIVNGGFNCKGLYFKLGKDIDFSEKTCKVVGNGYTFFQGSFDGNGHAMIGGTITQGLFFMITDYTVVKNLVVKDFTIESSQGGAITQYLSGVCTIQDCFVLDTNFYGKQCGAIVGQYWNGTISRNYYYGCKVYGVEMVSGFGIYDNTQQDTDGAKSVHTLSLDDGISVATTPTITFNGVKYYAAGKDITLSFTPPVGYAVDTVIYNDGSDHTINPDGNGAYIFTVPNNVAQTSVSATWLKSVSNKDVTVTVPTDTYTGSAVIPVVKDGGTALEKDTDYTISIKKGEENVSEIKDAGTYTITIMGEGIYAGTREETVTIKKADIDADKITAPVAKENIEYTGQARELVTAGYVTDGTMWYAVTGENIAPENKSAYTTSIPSKTDAGTYYVWYKVMGDENHNDVEPKNLVVSIKERQKPSDGTITTDGIYCASNHPSIQAGMVIHKSNEADTVEYRWVACDSSKPGKWFEVSSWTKDNNWMDWTPEKSGGYVFVCYARVVGNEEESLIQYAFGTEYHKEIKGICQMPYTGEGGGYLIGIESYNNPNNSYQYEMLILDCSLLAQGKDAWIYTTGRCGSLSNCLWTVWQPTYGYYWTLFRIYDSNGNLLDEVCYGFENVN